VINQEDRFLTGNAVCDGYLGSIDMKLRAHEGELKRRQDVLPPVETKRKLTKLWSPVPRHLELQKLLELFYGRFV
jgi:hypothetical protein